jgi:hypothetical protein
VTEPMGWAAYRAAWRRRPWVLLIGILAVAVLVVSIVATVAGGPLAFLFIPGLALLYGQHLLVKGDASR